MFWAFGVMLINAYLTYVQYNLKVGVLGKDLIFHHGFLKDIAVHWIGDGASNITERRRLNSGSVSGRIVAVIYYGTTNSTASL